MALALATAPAVAPAAAHACSVAAWLSPPARPTLLDNEAISALQAAPATITRGRPPMGCQQFGGISGCEGVGTISVAVTMTSPGPRSVCDFAYKVEVAGGTLPHSLSLTDDKGAPLVVGLRCGGDLPQGQGLLFLAWSDEAHDEQEPFSVDLRITPLAADRDGPPFLVHIEDAGRQAGPGRPPCPEVSGGCSVPPNDVAAAAPGVTALFLIVALVAIRRRGRRTWQCPRSGG